MTVAEVALDSLPMATPLPLHEVAKQIGVSDRTMWKMIRRYSLTKFRKIGMGKTVHIDPDELRRKWKPQRVEETPPAD